MRRKWTKLKWLLGGLFTLTVAAMVAVYAVLASLDFEDLRVLIQDEATKATGRAFTIAGPIDLRISLTPSIRLERVSLANAPWGSRPMMAEAERFEVEVALLPLLGGTLEAKRLVLIAPDILLETDAEGRGNWQLAAEPRQGEGGEGGDGAAPLPEFGRIAIRDGHLAYRDGGTGDRLELTLDAVDLEQGSGPLPLNLSLEGGYNGTPLSVDGRFAPLSRLRDGAFPFEVTLALGGSDLAGEGTLSIAGARPKVAASLSAERLDLADFTAAPAGDEGAKQDAERFVFPDDPLPFSALRAADAEIGLRAKLLQVRSGVSLADLDLQTTLNDGRLSLRPFTATVSGGVLEATLDVDATVPKPNVAASLVVKGLDFGQLQRAMEISENVSGVLDATLDLNGTGASPRQIAAGLDGRLEILSGEGRINGRLMKLAVGGMGSIIDPLLGGEAGGRLNCFVVRFDAKGGLATSRALLFDAEAFTVAGGGTIDLKTEAIDLKFDTETREVSLASLGVPFYIGGTLAAPTAAPDPLGAIANPAVLAGVLAGPVGVLGALVAKQGGGEGASKNACAAALASAGGSAAPGTADKLKSTLDNAAEGATKTLKNVGEGISKGLKSLFGN